MVANLLLNIVMVALLAVTIGYCWMLNRRIKVLQDSRSELAQLLKHFDESTQRASESIIALQTASKKIGENIQFRIDKANYLLDDLSFMIEKGNKLANQMEAGLAVNRARSRMMSEQAVREPALVYANEDTPPERPVEKTVEKPAVKTMERPLSVKDKTSASLEAVLGRVVGRVKGEEAQAQKPQRERAQPERNRSRAEQELLDMIKSGIKG